MAQGGGLISIKEHLKKLAPATSLRKLIIWKSFLSTCDPAIKNLLNDIRLPKLRQKQPLFLTEQEAFLLEHACYKSSFLNRDRLLVGLMLQLGLRLSEVLHLKFQDFEGEWLRLVRKGDKEQRLPISAGLKNLFETWRTERHPRPIDYVFEGRGEEPLTSRGAQTIIERLRKAAKIEKKISPHALRHTFASSLAAKGASLAALKEILGHRKITTTERYLHVTPDHLRETLNLLK
jgi:site-specific recombinase XerD